MTTGEIVIIGYPPLALLGALRMWQIGIRPPDLLVFLGNTAACAWLLFLFSIMSSAAGIAAVRELHVPGESWIRWLCLALSVLFYPITIRGIVLALKQRHDAVGQSSTRN